MVTCIVDVKHLGVLLEDRFEFANVSAHVERWRINEEQGLHSLAVSILEFLAEVLEIGVKSELHIERS